MPRAGLRCPGCGSSNIVDDDLYTQVQLVCVDCGAVVSEGSLVDDPMGGSAVSYNRSAAVAKKPCPNLIKGLQRLRALCRTLRVHNEIETLSESNFKRAYEHETFIKVSLQKKDVLAGCCVLVSCRQLSWPITMGTIGYLLDTDQAVVGAVYKEMLTVLNVTAPFVNVKEVMEAHCQEYKISSLHAPEELAADIKVLTKRSLALVEFAADSWVVTGRTPNPIMMAAVYLSWQSLNPNKKRLKVSLGKFCQLAKVNKPGVAMKRVTEMKERLCKLGKEIPWIKTEVTPENVVQHMGDILQHRFYLLRRALRTHEETLQAESKTSGEDSSDETPSDVPQLETQTPVSKPERSEKDSDDDPSEKNSREDPDPSVNWGKRLLFAPPCVTEAKKRRVERPQLQDVTGDEEISDSEIESYIRTPREARDFALMQRIMSEREKL